MGLNEDQMIEDWVIEDAGFYLDSKQEEVVQKFQNQRRKLYQRQLDILKNVTILDGSYDHLLNSDHYQKILRSIIEKYNLLNNRELSHA